MPPISTAQEACTRARKHLRDEAEQRRCIARCFREDASKDGVEPARVEHLVREADIAEHLADLYERMAEQLA